MIWFLAITLLDSQFLSILECMSLLLQGFLVAQRASLVTQTVKNPPAMQETWVKSLGPEHPLEEGMTTHSSILAWIHP